MLFAYNIFIYFYLIGIRLAAPFNSKARKWVAGRRDWQRNLAEKLGDNKDKIIWIHSASLGEFEQGRTLIDAIRSKHPHFKILVTFFSPSGYEIRKKYHGADYVIYLPIDTKKNATTFIEITKPSLVIFIKYELWYHYLKTLQERNIPTILISAIILPSQSYFGVFANFFQSMLQLFTHVFVQDDQSKNLLATIHIAENVSVAGDTRFDRVAETMRESFSNEALEHFCNNNQVLIAGSSWKEDEEALAFVQSKIPHLKIIIAPHEINASHLDSIKSIFKDAVLLSEYSFDQPAKVLIIDSIGMLSKTYRYATIAYVGGGFNLSGIHNVLEAAAYGKVVCWGPNYNRSAEASRMLELGCGFSYYKKEQLAHFIQNLLDDASQREVKNKLAKDFVESNLGATNRIMVFLQDSNML